MFDLQIFKIHGVTGADGLAQHRALLQTERAVKLFEAVSKANRWARRDWAVWTEARLSSEQVEQVLKHELAPKAIIYREE